MTDYNQSLSSILYVDHPGDTSSYSQENVHLYAFNLLHMLLYDYNNVKKGCFYYKNCPGFKELCEDYRKNIPKNIFKNGRLNNEHPKINLFSVYNHAITYALKKLGF